MSTIKQRFAAKPRAERTVEIAATVLRISDLSVWVNDGTQAVNLPKSLISVASVGDLDKLEKGKTYVFTVAEWKAKKEGLI